MRAWLTTTEIADLLGISPESVRRHIREGRLRAQALVAGERTTLRVRRDDYEAFRREYVRDTRLDDWER